MINTENTKAKIANEIINNALDRGCGVNVYLSDCGGLSVNIYQPEPVLAFADESAPAPPCDDVDSGIDTEDEAAAEESGCCNFCNNQLTEADLVEMVKQNGGKPVVVFVYCIDKDGTLALDCGEWEMFDGRDFVCAGVEDDLRGYGERFVAYKEPLPAPPEGGDPT